MVGIEVSVREARTRLADLIQRAQAGQEVVLTRRGSPAARLVAATRPDVPLPDLGAFRRTVRVRGAALSVDVATARRTARY